MSELSALEGLRQCLLPGDTQDGIDLEVPYWLVRKAADELATREARCERLERALNNIAMAGMDVPAAEGETSYYYKHELGRCIGVAAQALASQEEHEQT
jgi:hypothetical protein